jgi:hypothetical protein
MAAARAVERVAREEAFAPASCVAYGRDPRDRDLLRIVGHGVGIDYSGHLHPWSGRPTGIPGPAVGSPAPAADRRDRTAAAG